jgi:starch synthase
VGGLDETVDDSTGFKFQELSPEALVACLEKVVSVYTHEKEEWTEMMRRSMRKDFSWEASARAYSEVYSKLAALD